MHLPHGVSSTHADETETEAHPACIQEHVHFTGPCRRHAHSDNICAPHMHNLHAPQSASAPPELRRFTEEEGGVGLEEVYAVRQARARQAPAVVKAIQRVQPRHQHIVQWRACAQNWVGL